MLSPKRVKFRKMFKGRTTGLSYRGNEVSFGHYGLQALEPGWVTNRIPSWMGLWFAVFPTVETLAAQALAGAIVVGSYWLAKAPAASQRCKAECATDGADHPGGQAAKCDPFCVSATVCKPERERGSGKPKRSC